MKKIKKFKPDDIISPEITRRYYMELGKRIKKLRNEMKLTQDTFADELKIHSKQLAKYEIGKSTPSIYILARMAKFCEVPMEYLIYGKEDALSARTKITDIELLECFRKVNKLKKTERDKMKWLLKSLLNNSD